MAIFRQLSLRDTANSMAFIDLPAPMIGQTISHYRIVEKLGGGGIGVVYEVCPFWRL